jgi:hypothetical protein
LKEPMECCSSPSEKSLAVLRLNHLTEAPGDGLVLEDDLATAVADVAALVAVVVLAADLETVADTSNASDGDGSASDVVLLVAFVDTAVELLAVTALHVLVVVVVVIVGGLLGLVGLVGLVSRRAGKGKGTSGESEDGKSGELHVEGLENCLSRKRVLKSRAEDVVE